MKCEVITEPAIAQKLIAVFHQLAKPDFDVPDDTWLHKLLDLCQAEIADPDKAQTLLESDFMTSLLDLILKTSDKTDDQNSNFKPDILTFGVSTYFTLLQHSDRFHDLLGNTDNIHGTSLDLVLDAVGRGWEEASLRSGVFLALKRLVCFDAAFRWLSKDLKFLLLAVKHLKDNSIFVQRDAKDFLVTFLAKQAQMSGSFSDFVANLSQSEGSTDEIIDSVLSALPLVKESDTILTWLMEVCEKDSRFQLEVKTTLYFRGAMTQADYEICLTKEKDLTKIMRCFCKCLGMIKDNELKAKSYPSSLTSPLQAFEIKENQSLEALDVKNLILACATAESAVTKGFLFNSKHVPLFLWNLVEDIPLSTKKVAGMKQLLKLDHALLRKHGPSIMQEALKGFVKWLFSILDSAVFDNSLLRVVLDCFLEVTKLSQNDGPLVTFQQLTSKLKELHVNAVNESSWEKTDTILEFLTAFLEQQQPHTIDELIPWLLSVISSRQYRGPSASYVRATGISCLTAVYVSSALPYSSETNAMKQEFLDVLNKLASPLFETEAIVRRACIDAFKSLLISAPNIFEQSELDCIMKVVEESSNTDFDFDVKRKAVEFWTACVELKVNDNAVAILAYMADNDVDASVRTKAKEQLSFLVKSGYVQPTEEIVKTVSIPVEAQLSPFLLLDDILNCQTRLKKQYIEFGDDTDNMADCY